MSTGLTLPTGPSALIVAHPGHELRLHGWLEQVRPLVFVLTDGSGSTRESRLTGTERVITAAGARRGPVFGRFADRQWYDAILRRDCGLFTTLADEIASALVREKVVAVVADAEEGYNSGHDLCRAIADSAVLLASRVSRRDISSFDFLLVGHPESTDGLPSVGLRLDEAALHRKLSAAREYSEMSLEVDSALRRFGLEAFRIERLRQVPPGGRSRQFDEGIFFYERFGETQVAAGLYTEVIRAREHVIPLVEALQRHGRAQTTCGRSSSC